MKTFYSGLISWNSRTNCWL